MAAETLPDFLAMVCETILASLDLFVLKSTLELKLRVDVHPHKAALLKENRELWDITRLHLVKKLEGATNYIVTSFTPHWVPENTADRIMMASYMHKLFTTLVNKAEVQFKLLA